MSQFNSIFSPLTNKLARLAGITLLAVAALFANTQNGVAQTQPNTCVSSLEVRLDDSGVFAGTCARIITPQMVVLGSVNNLYVVINDLNPTNNGTSGTNQNAQLDGISPASGWSYGVYFDNGTTAVDPLVCQGVIYAVDYTAPRVTAHPADHNQLLCDDIDHVLNKKESWDLTTNNYAWYTGKPVFSDNCGGQVQVKVTDRIDYTDCGVTGAPLRMATITRRFQLIDQRGNDTTITQLIHFNRPDRDRIRTRGGLPTARAAKDVINFIPVYSTNSANNDANLNSYLVSNTEAAPNMIVFDKCTVIPDGKEALKPYLRSLYMYKYANTTSGKTGAASVTESIGADSISLFDPAGICNWSSDFTYTEFPTCNGKKFMIKTTFVDWCNSANNFSDFVVFAFEDRTPPLFAADKSDVGSIKSLAQASTPATGGKYGQTTTPFSAKTIAPADTVLISVGTNDCTASLRVRSETSGAGTDLRDLNTLFNLKVTDACSGTTNSGVQQKVTLQYQVETKGYWNQNYFVDQNYTVTPYTTMRDGSAINILGLPIGTHRLKVIAHDGCNNKDSIYLSFKIVDNVAPIMKCDDEIVVALTSNSSTNYFRSLSNTESLDKNQMSARIRVSDINEGSSDNCTLDSMYVRRKFSWNSCRDFVKLNMDYDLFGNNSNGTVEEGDFEPVTGQSGMYWTPKNMQYIEVFCCDGTSVDVELWGSDAAHYSIVTGTTGDIYSDPSVRKRANWSNCWTKVTIEDNTPPVVTKPNFNKTYNSAAVNFISCREKEWIQGGNLYSEIIGDNNGLNAEGNRINNDNLTHGKIATVAAANARFGTPDILGIECSGQVRYSVHKKLTCDTGVILRVWDVTKVDKNGKTITASDTQIIWVEASHEYSITVPADAVTFNCPQNVTESAPTFSEAGCDLLAISGKTQTIYDAADGENACKKLYNTWTIINWCQVPNQFSCSSADPMNFARVIPRLSAVTGSTSSFNAASATLSASSVKHTYTQSNTNSARDHGDRTGAPYIQYINGVPTSVTGANWPSTAKSGTYKMVQGTGTTDRLADYLEANIPSTSCTDYNKRTFAWTYTQVVKVSDTEKPTLNSQANNLKFVPNKTAGDDVNWNANLKVFGVRGNYAEPTTPVLATGECKALVKFYFELDDNCIDRFSIVNSIIVNAQTPLSSTPLTGITPNVTAATGNATRFNVEINNISIGSYELLVTFRDECGNVAVDRIPFRVADIKAPAPVCVQRLTVSLMPTNDAAAPNLGMAVVKAKDVFQDINRNWLDEECSNSVNAYIVRETLAKANPTAADIKAYKDTVQANCRDFADIRGLEVRVYLIDGSDNFNYCSVIIEVEDNAGICPDGQSSAAVAGAIQTESKATVEGVQVNLSGQSQKSFATGVNGLFVFNNLTAGADYTVTPSLNKGFLNGVSTFDLVLISKHILGVQPLNTPYKLIAADVNNSKSVTTLDLIQLRKLILNIDASFANNTSWRFVDASYTFPNASNPWAASFPEVKNVNDLVGSLTANFVAIKVGDVNGNAIANSTQGSVRNLTSNLGINVADMNLVAGNEYKVDFTAADLNGVEGFQFTLNLDKKGLELVDLVPGIAAEENFGIFAEEGVVTASWNGEAKGGVLFSLVVRAKSNTTLSEVLNLNSRYTAAEAYKGGEVMNVGLNFNAVKASANYELYQNTPNPFAGETVIGFNLPVAGQATLTIQDVTGRTLKVINGQYAKGYNQVNLKSTELTATGVLTYTLKAADFTATRKMIIVE